MALDSYYNELANQDMLQVAISAQVLLTIEAKGHLFTAMRVNGVNRQKRYAAFIQQFSTLVDMTFVMIKNGKLVSEVDNFLSIRDLKYSVDNAYRATNLFKSYLTQMNKDGIYDPRRKVPYNNPDNAYMRSIG